MKDNTKTTEASTNKLDLTTKRIDSSKITVEPVKTERVLKKNVNNKSKEQYHEKETSANQLDFMKKLSKVDVSKIKVLRFYPNNELPFTIRSENIKKITKLVVNKF